MKRKKQTTQLPDRTTAGYFVYLARVRKDLSQERLAELAGVSVGTVRHIERDKHIPTKYTRDRIFKVLDIDPYYYESLLESSTDVE